jgi:hypothetical protein
LKEFCKIYERNKKTEKRKRRKEEKYRKRATGANPAQYQKQPVAQEGNRNGIF